MPSFIKTLLRSFSIKKRQTLPVCEGPVRISNTAHFTFPRKIKLGAWVRIGKRCYLNGEGGITIGEGTIFAPEVVVLSSTHRHEQEKYLPFDEYDEFRPVLIGCGVWLGYRAMIVPGITIGDGAIIAMGAVVSHDVPAGAIVAGNPAKIVKQREAEWVKAIVEKKRYYLKEVLENGLDRIKDLPAEDELRQ